MLLAEAPQTRLGRLLDRHRERALRVAWRLLLGDRVGATTAARLAFLELATTLDGFEKDRKAVRALDQVIVAQARRIKRQPVHATSRVHAAMETLSEAQRAAIVLVGLEGYPPDAAATALEIDRERVRSAFLSGVRALRDQLPHLHPDGASEPADAAATQATDADRRFLVRIAEAWDPPALTPQARAAFDRSVLHPPAAWGRPIAVAAIVFIVTLAAGLPVVWFGVDLVFDWLEPPPNVRWKEAVAQGARNDARIMLDPCFMSETGQGARGLQIRRVTDFDGDHVDEVWLRWPADEPEYERIYTFGDDGRWLLVGEVPPGCLDDPTPDRPFPDLVCSGGHRYRFSTGAAEPDPSRCAEPRGVGSYQTIEGTSSALVAWMPDPAGGPPLPYRMALDRRHRGSLAGFLASRGVTGAIHFLICEDAVPGIGAQVLTAHGELRELMPGCVKDLHLDGPQRTAVFGASLPVAVSFTRTGYEALLDQVAVFRSGCTDDLFWSEADANLLAVMRETPRAQEGTALSFRGTERLFRSIADENPDIRVRGRPLRRSGMPTSGPDCAVWRARGRAAPAEALIGPDCSRMQVKLGKWRCGLPCTSGANFLEVTEVGCPDTKGTSLLEATYAGGLTRVRQGDLELRARVEVENDPIDVLSVAFGWRTIDPAGEDPRRVPQRDRLRTPAEPPSDDPPLPDDLGDQGR